MHGTLRPIAFAVSWWSPQLPPRWPLCTSTACSTQENSCCTQATTRKRGARAGTANRAMLCCTTRELTQPKRVQCLRKVSLYYLRLLAMTLGHRTCTCSANHARWQHLLAVHQSFASARASRDWSLMRCLATPSVRCRRRRDGVPRAAAAAAQPRVAGRDGQLCGRADAVPARAAHGPLWRGLPSRTVPRCDASESSRVYMADTKLANS